MLDRSEKIKKLKETKLANALGRRAASTRTVKGLTLIAGLAKMKKMKLAQYEIESLNEQIQFIQNIVRLKI